MSRQPMSSPLSVLLAGVIVIVLLLAGTGANTSAITRQQASTPTWTPCPDDEEDSSFDCLDFRDDLTATAEAATESATAAYPYPSPGTPTGTARASSATPTGTTRAGSATPSAPPTSAARQATNTPIAAGQVVATSALPSPTPTPADTLACLPGSPVLITGRGPAHAPLLLFFDQRAVGGGSASADGSFALTLTVGQERPGQYEVAVRVRGSSQVLRQLTCTVSSATPTAAPLARR